MVTPEQDVCSGHPWISISYYRFTIYWYAVLQHSGYFDNSLADYSVIPEHPIDIFKKSPSALDPERLLLSQNLYWIIFLEPDNCSFVM
jgi:hypothetical protein